MIPEGKIIMYDTPAAATYKTGIEGWVSSNGQFFGNGKRAEELARYAGSTHHKCECGGIARNGLIRCEDCGRKHADKVYKKLPYKEWDYKTPVCLYDVDEYFFDENSLIDYLYDNGLNGGDVQLVLCKPMMYRPIGVETIASDAHEEWRPPKELEERIDQFNDFLTTLPPHSWEPDNIRTSYEYEYKPE